MDFYSGRKKLEEKLDDDILVLAPNLNMKYPNNKNRLSVCPCVRVCPTYVNCNTMYFIEQNRDTLEDGNQIIHDLIGTIGTTD